MSGGGMPDWTEEKIERLALESPGSAILLTQTRLADSSMDVRRLKQRR